MSENKLCLCCQKIKDFSEERGTTLTKYTSTIEYPPLYEWQDNYCLDCFRDMMLSLGQIVLLSKRASEYISYTGNYVGYDIWAAIDERVKEIKEGITK